YDSGLSGSDLLNFGSLGPTTANIYNNWLAANSAAVGTRANFYNVNDFALNIDHWQLDEKVKPDSAAGIHPAYGYRGTPDDNPPWQDGFYGTYIWPLQMPLYLGSVTDVKDRYEITAFAAESRSKALGGITSVAGF